MLAFDCVNFPSNHGDWAKCNGLNPDPETLFITVITISIFQFLFLCLGVYALYFLS